MGYISYPRSTGGRLDHQRVQEVLRLIEGLSDIIMPTTLNSILVLVNQIDWHNLPQHIKTMLLSLMRNKLYRSLDPQITTTPQEQQAYRENIQTLNSKMVDIGLSLNTETSRPIHEQLNATGMFDFRVAQPHESKAVTSPVLIDSNGMVLTIVTNGQEVIENWGAAIIQTIYAYPNDASAIQNSYLRGKYSVYSLPENKVVATNFIGKYKGESVTLNDVEVREINYTRRSRETLDELRKKFDSSVRRNYLKSVGNDPERVEVMKAAGLTDAQITKVAQGGVPKGYNVHHKIPIDDGGTNDFDNLVLIRNNSEHYTITNAQRDLTSHIPYGETVKIKFPVPPSFLYPLKGHN